MAAAGADEALAAAVPHVAPPPGAPANGPGANAPGAVAALVPQAFPWPTTPEEIDSALNKMSSELRYHLESNQIPLFLMARVAHLGYNEIEILQRSRMTHAESGRR